MTVTINSATTIKGQTQAGGLVPTVSADFTLLTANNLPSWLSFSRTTGAVSPLFGNAMQYDQNGFLTWAPANLLTYSQDFNNSAWVKSGVTRTPGQTDPLGGSTAYTLQLTPSTGLIYEPLSGFPAIKAILSGYFKGTPGDQVVLGFLGGVAILCTLTSSWQRFSIVLADLSAVSGAVIGSAYNVNQTTNPYQAWGIQLEPVTYQTTPRTYQATTSSAWYGARLDYDPSVVPARARGLLIEEQRANLAVNTNALTTGWSSDAGATMAPNIVVSPDGTQNASQLQINTTNYRYSNIATTVSTTYSQSLFVKLGSGGNGQFVFESNTSTYFTTTFNLTTGTVVSSNATNPSIKSVGNGWYLCSHTFVAGAATTTFGFTLTGTFAVGQGHYFFGAQLEAGAFPTSYIPNSLTTGSVTRAADTAALTGPALAALQGAEGTAIGEYNQFGSKLGYFDRLIMADNTSLPLYNTMIAVYTSGAEVYIGGAIQAGYNNPNPAINTNHRNAFAWKVNDFNMSFDGTLKTTDTSGNVPTTINAGYLGYFRDSTWLNGWVRSVSLYNQRIPNATLQTLSTVP